MKSFIVPALSAVAALLSGCAAGTSDPGRELKLICVPTVRQATDHTCGVASLQSILMYHGIDCREDILAGKLNVTDHAKIAEIDRYMTGLGFKVTQYREMSLDDLKKLLDRGLPVLVCVQAWEAPGTTVEAYRQCRDSGHWVVAIGCDAANVYVMDPSTLGNYAYVPIDEFVARWHDSADGETFIRFGMTFESAKPPVYRPDEIKKME